MAIIRPAELKLKQKKKVERAMSSEFQNFMSTNSSLLELKTFFAIGAGLIWSPTMGKFNYIFMKKKHKKSWKIAVWKFDSWSDPMISMSRLSSLSIIFVDNSPDLNSNYLKKCELSGHLQVLVIKTERKLHRKR